MWILPLVGYLGILLGFGFLTLAIASGLYYLSELVEEHTVIAKRVLTRMIYGVIGLQLLLCLVDPFPFTLSLLGIIAHVVYLGNMTRFPVVRLSSPLFISACVLVLVHHYLSFRHFSTYTPATMMRSRFDTPDYPSFSQIASYFGICVWLVPFSLFVSLSASDNVLPTMNTEEPIGAGGDKNKGTRQGMAKVLVDRIRDGLGEVTKTITGSIKTDRDKSF